MVLVDPADSAGRSCANNKLASGALMIPSTLSDPVQICCTLVPPTATPGILGAVFSTARLTDCPKMIVSKTVSFTGEVVASCYGQFKELSAVVTARHLEA